MVRNNVWNTSHDIVFTLQLPWERDSRLFLCPRELLKKQRIISLKEFQTPRENRHDCRSVKF